MAWDLLIKGGTLVDGTGADRRSADVALTGQKIAAVGDLSGEAARVIDATGKIVAPGFIDPHTHYDAQIFWDPLVTSTSWHGVTSVVMGNCGVGIAPCRPPDREVNMMDLVNVEAMSMEVLKAGLPWNWETFPEFMDAAAANGSGINLGFLMPLASLRHYVIGRESTERAATPEETAQIATLIEEGVSAGALGFSTTILPQHIGFQGRPLASRLASMDELRAYANALRNVGKGIIEIALSRSLGQVQPEEYELVEMLLRESGRPLTWAFMLSPDHNPGVALETLSSIRPLYEQGAVPQVSCRPFLTQVELRKPFIFSDRQVMGRAFNTTEEEQLKLYKDQSFRDDLKKALEETPGVFRGQWDRLEVQFVTDTSLEPLIGRSVAEIAAERSEHPVDTFFELGLADNLDMRFLYTIANTDVEVVGQLVGHDETLVGASDGGAHVDQICDAGYATYMLQNWVREQGKLTLERAVQRLSAEPAALFGLTDRGTVTEQKKADIVVFDADTVGSDRLPESVWDLPGGERRLVSRPRGISGVIVNGEPLFLDGEHCGGLPGEVLRP